MKKVKWKIRSEWIVVLLISPIALPIMFFIVWKEEGFTGAVRTFKEGTGFKGLFNGIWAGKE